MFVVSTAKKCANEKGEISGIGHNVKVNNLVNEPFEIWNGNKTL